jgi:hypothetical protein
MRIKIHGGTVDNGQSPLCHTCRNATVVRGARLRDEVVACAALGYRDNRIEFPVTSCSDYLSRQHPSLRELEETAWVLRTDPKRHRLGFVPSKNLKPQDRFVLEEE